VDVGVQSPTKNVFKQLEEEVPRIWAEAFCYWQLGETLYLTGEVEEEAKQEQESHRESSAKEGVIREFVERRVPLNWDKRTLPERLLYWSGEFGRGDVETAERDRICALEVWCECLKGDLKYMKRADAIEINSILATLPGWQRSQNGLRFGVPYGLQKGFIRA